MDGGQGRRRSVDLRFFRPALYQLSYLTPPDLMSPTAEFWRILQPHSAGNEAAGTTGFEPATSGLTGRRTLQTVLRALEFARDSGQSSKYICRMALLNIAPGWVGGSTGLPFPASLAPSCR
jgi:hypothetical protein